MRGSLQSRTEKIQQDMCRFVGLAQTRERQMDAERRHGVHTEGELSGHRNTIRFFKVVSAEIF